EVFLVVVLVAQQVPGELDHGLRGIQHARGWLPDLAHDGPCCNLQTVTLRPHFLTPMRSWVVDGRVGAHGGTPTPGRPQNGASSPLPTWSPATSTPESAASRCAGLPRGMSRCTW